MTASKVPDRSVLDSRKINRVSFRRLPPKVSTSLDFGDKSAKRNEVVSKLTLNEYDFNKYNTSVSTKVGESSVLQSTRNMQLKSSKIAVYNKDLPQSAIKSQ